MAGVERKRESKIEKKKREKQIEKGEGEKVEEEKGEGRACWI